MTIFTLEHDESKDWTPLRITIHDGIAENAFHRAKENISRNGSQPNTVLPVEKAPKWERWMSRLGGV